MDVSVRKKSERILRLRYHRTCDDTDYENSSSPAGFVSRWSSLQVPSPDIRTPGHASRRVHKSTFPQLTADRRDDQFTTRLRSAARKDKRGVEPVFPEKRQAINYAQTRACFRSGEIRILDSGGNAERVIPFDETDRRM